MARLGSGWNLFCSSVVDSGTGHFSKELETYVHDLLRFLDAIMVSVFSCVHPYHRSICCLSLSGGTRF